MLRVIQIAFALVVLAIAVAQIGMFTAQGALNAGHKNIIAHYEDGYEYAAMERDCIDNLKGSQVQYILLSIKRGQFAWVCML